MHTVTCLTDVEGEIGSPKLVEVVDGVTVQEWPEVEKELPLQSAEQAMIPNAAANAFAAVSSAVRSCLRGAVETCVKDVRKKSAQCDFIGSEPASASPRVCPLGTYLGEGGWGARLWAQKPTVRNLSLFRKGLRWVRC